MKRISLQHVSSIVLVSILLGIVFVATRPAPMPKDRSGKAVELLQKLALDPNDSFQNALFQDMAAAYGGADSTHFLKAWQQFRLLQKAELNRTSSRYRQKMANRLSLGTLLGMYLNFIWIYLLVMLLTYYGVQTLGTYLFVRYKQHRPPDMVRLLTAARKALSHPSQAAWTHLIRTIGLGLLKIFAYFILFAPAYVIAYSIKSDFDTESTLFLILLGIISNGVLITYANKFFHLLLSESRKGYVQTAVIKNLKNDFTIGSPKGIAWRDIFALRKTFHGHILRHIFMNAHFQYLATFKEQAAFVITGLIIIEMALNIHGHLSYQLLQQLLYRNYDLAILIIWGLFLLVKITEWATDILLFRIKKRLGYQ